MNKITRIRNLVWAAVVLGAGTNIHAQSTRLTLDECYALARSHYPQTRKLELVARSSGYALSNAAKLYLPQLSISGQASYQSETMDFSEVLGEGAPPGIHFPEISKDQYKVQAEISQTIYDGGEISNRRAYIRADQAMRQQQVEVSLYAVKERVNQVYFSILLMEEQLRQNEIRKADLQSAADKTAAALDNGAAFRSDLNELKAEIVNADMTGTTLRTGRSAYLRMLGILIGQALGDSTRLVKPEPPAPARDIRRPELKGFALQDNLYDVREKQLGTAYLPRLSAFVQGAYGRPTLNIIDNNWGPWYIAGARLSWNLSSLYSLKNNRRSLEVDRQNLAADKATFLLNTGLSLEQEEGDIDKYRALVAEDRKAIALRSAVTQSARAQLENGVITTHEYIAQLNAEHMARQTLILHNLQLLQAQYKLKHITGN
ncbi:TolC family protein [Compostibacter hankyongensis]|uniref:TolC family protein n=1 Tax=Compostibacter hankyongensis TaxID=1007089 RepID=A0ABP8G2L0_9BACT